MQNGQHIFIKWLNLIEKEKKKKTWAIKQQGLHNKMNQDCYTDNIFMILKKKENVTKRFPNQKNWSSFQRPINY